MLIGWARRTCREDWEDQGRQLRSEIGLLNQSTPRFPPRKVSQLISDGRNFPAFP